MTARNVEKQPCCAHLLSLMENLRRSRNTRSHQETQAHPELAASYTSLKRTLTKQNQRTQYFVKVYPLHTAHAANIQCAAATSVSPLWGTAGGTIVAFTAGTTTCQGRRRRQHLNARLVFLHRTLMAGIPLRPASTYWAHHTTFQPRWLA